MVSTKFARSKHAFRVPDVCKKKKEAEENGEYPPPIVHFQYDVDVRWLWFHHQFQGMNTLNIEDQPFGLSWRWLDTPVAPANGAWCRFQHTWVGGMWNATLQYFQGGILQLAGLAVGNIPNSPPQLHTGLFVIDFGLIWVGKRDGEIDS